jgi:RNA recognition motif-containing protein
MSEQRQSRSRGGRGNRGGRGRQRNRGRRRSAPAKKQNPIAAFFSRLFGGKDSGRNGQNRKNGKAPRSGKASSERQKPDTDNKPEQMPEVNSTRLYVGNLPYESSESDLFDHFGQIGQVKNVEIVRDRNDRSKGFAFVEMNSVETAKTVSEKFHRTEFQGRQIIVAGAKN